jgi:hypothetical protein
MESGMRLAPFWQQILSFLSTYRAAASSGEGFVQGSDQCELQIAADTAAFPMPVTWFSTLALAFSFPLVGT